MVGECIYKNVKIYGIQHNVSENKGDKIEWWSADVKVGTYNAQTVTVDKKFADFQPDLSILYDLTVDVSEQNKRKKFKVVGIAPVGKRSMTIDK